MNFVRTLRPILLLLVLLLKASSVRGGATPVSWPADDGKAVLWREMRAEAGLTASIRNVILFVGDGMGPEHVRAAGLYLGRPLVFETFAHRSSMATNSVNGVTDSAASATAMATGQRVYNGVISMALPGDGSELETVLEMWQALGKRSGLVTTSIVNDATLAAFAAHEPSRGNLSAIAGDYFEDARPEVLLGGAGSGVTPQAALAAGYAVVTDTVGLQALDTETDMHVSGQFGPGKLPPMGDGRAPLPSLAQMTETALAILQNGQRGFFLVVEQEHTDTYSHRNDLTPVVDAVIELEGAVYEALDWAAGRDDTLILVTADHETGGLRIDGDNGPGALPDVTWEAGRSHTTTPVPIFARGPQAALLALVEANVDLYYLLGPAGFENTVYFPLSASGSGGFAYGQADN